MIGPQGALMYDYDTTQEVDSSPAIGGFLAGGAVGIAVGTGSYYKGASDTDTLKAFTSRLVPVWSETLDGLTSSSPALADVEGNGQLEVVEGTDTGTSGSRMGAGRRHRRPHMAHGRWWAGSSARSWPPTSPAPVTRTSWSRPSTGWRCWTAAAGPR